MKNIMVNVLLGHEPVLPFFTFITPFRRLSYNVIVALKFKD